MKAATPFCRIRFSARAIYPGGTVYRMHGTNQPSTIGIRVSPGCIGLTNEDVTDLTSRVNINTKVIVLPIERQAQDFSRPTETGSLAHAPFLTFPVSNHSTILTPRHQEISR